MSRLINYLLETNVPENNKTRSIPITEEQFLEYLKTKCKNYNEDYKLFRGIRSNPKSDYLYIDPSKHTRTSEYANNWYILVIEQSKEWKNFPKLSKSIITTNSKDNSTIWGSKYEVIPFDGANFAYTANVNLWASFRLGMDTFSFFVEMIFEEFNIQINKKETDINKFLKVCNFIDEKIKENKKEDRDKIEKVIKQYNIVYGEYLSKVFEGKKLINVFEQILSPKDVAYTSNNLITIPKNKEIWTESQCILRRYD